MGVFLTVTSAPPMQGENSVDLKMLESAMVDESNMSTD